MGRKDVYSGGELSPEHKELRNEAETLILIFECHELADYPEKYITKTHDKDECHKCRLILVLDNLVAAMGEIAARTEKDIRRQVLEEIKADLKNTLGDFLQNMEDEEE